MTLEDLNSIDSYSYQMLNSIRQYSGFLLDEEFANTVSESLKGFTTVLSSGDEVELCPGGEAKEVTKENFEEYISLVLQARSMESCEQMKSLLSGI